MKRALCIWFPNWPLQRLTAKQPELKGRPVVLHETVQGVQRVAALSPEAAALGITPGMPIAEVTTLQAPGKEKRGWEKADVGKRGKRKGEGRKKKEEREESSLKFQAHGRRPVGLPSQQTSPTILPHDPTADREALESLAVWSGRFSPTVAVEQSPAPECLLLDITGLAHLFGGEVSLGETILEGFGRLGLVASVGVADTIGAAWAVARYGGEGLVGSPTGRRPWAWTGEEVSSSVGVTIVPVGETAAALRPLPIGALRLPEDVVDLLRQLGIDRIGQLERLPRDQLGSRFGPELLRRWNQALGRLPEPVPSQQQPPELLADWSPQQPTARQATIEAALESLIARVAAMLVPLGVGIVRLQCRFDCTTDGIRAAEPVVLSVAVFEPTASAKHLFDLAKMQLERLRLPAPVSSIHVAATATAPLVHRQQEMFLQQGDTSREDSRRLADLI
ncbi:MAG TPA: DNA polymerase Y family protein, partial [Thermoguttaceae bacterium]|nr:DNA polymerase Y family protein [Thermoguttaceae bacterium]